MERSEEFRPYAELSIESCNKEIEKIHNAIVTLEEQK